jgi:hypothetical protein
MTNQRPVYIVASAGDIEFALALQKELEHRAVSAEVADEASWRNSQLADFVPVVANHLAILILISSATIGDKNWEYQLNLLLRIDEAKFLTPTVVVTLDEVRKSFGLAIGGPPVVPVKRAAPAEAAENLVLALASRITSGAIRREERQEAQQKIETSAEEFIKTSLEALSQQEARYRRAAYFCYYGTAIVLVVCIGFAGWRALSQQLVVADWLGFAEFSIAGLIVVSLLIALARYAFVLGKAVMVESLRNADRRHAISFGHFYLRAFGADASWPDLKDAFQNWNIDRGSSFISQAPSDIDPQIVAAIADLLKATKNRATSEKP